VPVELHGRHPVDGLAAPLSTDAIVALCGGYQAVVHELLQYRDVDAGVSVPLRGGYLYSISQSTW
jgi:hypothetical protein